MMASKELRFQRYDFGTNCSIAKPFEETCNQQKYGSLMPTEYDLSKITAPVVSGVFGRTLCCFRPKCTGFWGIHQSLSPPVLERIMHA